MKALFIHIITPATLLMFAASCGQGGDPHHGHHHGHGHQGNESLPLEVTLSQAAFEQNGIRVGEVQQQTLKPMFSVPARVAFNEETTAHVGTLVRGRVSAMWAHLGQTVTNGAPLFDILSPELGQAQNVYLQALAAEAAARPALVLARNEAGVAQAEATVKAAEAMLALARNPAAVMQAKGKLDAAKPALERAKELYETGRKLAATGALANTELKRRLAARETAAAEVRATEAGLAQAKAQQARDTALAQAELEAAQAGFTAAKAVLAKEIGAAENVLKSASDAAATARNRLKLFGMDNAALDRLARTRALDPVYKVRAPRAGTVVEREVTRGENASPDQPHLLLLADLSQVWVLMELTSVQAREVRQGMEVVLQDKNTNEATRATLDFLSPTVDSETHTIQARVEIPNLDGRWRPGQFLTAQIPTKEKPVVTLAVPEGAVQEVDGQATVYVQPDAKKLTFKARPVIAGKPIGGFHPVSGLELGERVVVSGSFLLKAEFGKAGAGHDHSH